MSLVYSILEKHYVLCVLLQMLPKEEINDRVLVNFDAIDRYDTLAFVISVSFRFSAKVLFIGNFYLFLASMNTSEVGISHWHCSGIKFHKVFSNNKIIFGLSKIYIYLVMVIYIYINICFPQCILYLFCFKCCVYYVCLLGLF